MRDKGQITEATFTTVVNPRNAETSSNSAPCFSMSRAALVFGCSWFVRGLSVRGGLESWALRRQDGDWLKMTSPAEDPAACDVQKDQAPSRAKLIRISVSCGQTGFRKQQTNFRSRFHIRVNEWFCHCIVLSDSNLGDPSSHGISCWDQQFLA
jgi:hypothetical protein